MATLRSRAREDTAERRRYVLRAHEAVLSTYTALTRENNTPDAEHDRLVDDLFWTGEGLRREYLDLLPVVAVSRCPHTSAVVSLPIDTFDLDGLWWAYQSPLRVTGDRPPSLIALTGALRLGGDVPLTSFLVKPGPEAPYVIPRLLADDAVTAVVTQLAVGPHTGYVIAYFSAAPDRTTVRANDWGAGGFTRIDVDGTLEFGAVPENPSELDFALAPWVEQRRVRWITPGDEALALHDGPDGCPFLDLPGRRELLRIEEGVVR